MRGVIVVAPGGRWEGYGYIPALALCERDLGEAGQPANREHHRCTLRACYIDLRGVRRSDITNIADIKCHFCADCRMRNPEACVGEL